MIAILHAGDPAFVREAAKRGVLAYIVDGTPGELQSDLPLPPPPEFPTAPSELERLLRDTGAQ